MGGLLSKVIKPVKLVSEYVQTDDIDELRVETILRTPCVKIIKDSLLDPRSATLGIKRTPIVVFTQNPDSSSSPRPRTYLETDIDAIDAIETPKRRNARDQTKNSPELQDFKEKEVEELAEKLKDEVLIEAEPEKKCIEEEIIETQKAIEDSEINVPEVEEEGNVSVEESFAEAIDLLEASFAPYDALDSPCIGVRRSSIEDLRKRLLNTPDLSKTPEPLKTKSGRTPLGVVSSNVIKPWKGIDEERRKLGLENTPPSLPPPLLDASQSAPGKVFSRSRQRWDSNATFII